MLGDDSDNLDKNGGKFLNAFIITTVPEGHNCGRKYYLQAASPDMYAEATQHLGRNKKEARKRAEFNTRFAKSQYWVRKIFNSRPFQNFAAFLITMVSLKIFCSISNWYFHLQFSNLDPSCLIFAEI